MGTQRGETQAAFLMRQGTCRIGSPEDKGKSERSILNGSAENMAEGPDCMLKEEEFHWKRGDIFAVAGVLLFAAGIALCFFRNGYGRNAARAEVYLNGEKVREVSLSENQTFMIKGEYINTVTVQDGRISVSYSDCPGEDCVHTGWKSRGGESIVCLPNRMEIRITGETEVDAVTGDF